MSDNPTLWVHPVCDCKGRNGSHLTVCASLNTRSASRADLLAALPDKEWWCTRPLVDDDGRFNAEVESCTPDDPHDDWACHWAVKP